MAVYTPLTLADASRITLAHGLGETTALTPIAAGSVNTNYFVDTPAGRRFLRVYEEQEEAGVAYEWALLDHLGQGGVPVPARIPGPPPGALRHAGKPTALFEEVFGRELRQREITPSVAREVGRRLGQVHRVTAEFGWRRAGRFRRADLRGRLAWAAERADDGLRPVIDRLQRELDALDREEPTTLPVGVTHGDLFRDNVRFEGDSVVALLDWESAADGVLAYDLAVTMLAFCYGDALELDTMAAMAGGYDAERPMAPDEWMGLHFHLRAAAVRFTTTRITDFHLRPAGVGERVMKDYRRFLARLDAVSSFAADGLADRLGRPR